MENLTADQVLQKTFEHLEQMLDEKQRSGKKGREEFHIVDSVSEDAVLYKKKGEEVERS